MKSPVRSRTVLSNAEVSWRSYDPLQIAAKISNPFGDRKPAALKKLRRALGKHMAYLVVQHKKCIVQLPYGKVALDEPRWDKERRLLIDAVFDGDLPPRALEVFHKEFSQVIDAAVQAAAAAPADGGKRPEPGSMTPREFELHCAAVLKKAGWKSAAMSGSADQGIDVVAERDGTKVVLQCKLYSKPVGNAAVQEAHAGMAVAGAHHSAVVSVSGYTASARTAAASTRTLLLHPSELPTLAQLLRAARATAR
jgi:restriction system protein